MDKKKSVFTSQKFLVFNIVLVSIIVGFTLSTLLIWACSSGQFRFPNAFAQDQDSLEAGYKALENIQYSFRNVANVALPVVVEINVVEVVKGGAEQGSPWEYFFQPPGNGREGENNEFRRPGLGSGVIVKREGGKVYVITNNHVAGNASEISISLHDGRTFPGRIVAKDERTDLALISFETGEDIPVAKLGDSDSVFVGDWAIAIGNPFGFESTLTVGVVSAVGRQAAAGSGIAAFNQYLQTDAEINPGNSGGALLNVRGEIIGINTWIASQTGSSAGVGFAIPINSVKKVMEDFLSKGRVEYGWLGVGIDDPTDQAYPGVAEDLGVKGKKGAMVISVFKDSPAYKDGIYPGDYILRVDNTNINDANHLTRIVGNLPPNKAVTFVLIRDKKEMTVRVTLVVRDSEEKVRANTAVWPGFMAVRMNDDIRKRLSVPHTVAGMFVSSVTQGSQAETAGLKAGDVVMKINDTQAGNTLDFFRALNDRSKGDIILRVWRNNKEIILGIVR